MRSFTFNGIKKPWVIMLRGRQKAPFAPLRRNLLVVPGMHGAYLQSTDVEPIVINQPIGFKVDDDEHALQLKDELAEWLVTDEPVPLEFDDEPGRIYYAVVQNTIDDFEKFAELRQGTIQFLCPDPYAYGEELEATFPSDVVTLNNNGTADADPVFELEVLQPVTFAMIQNQDDEYMMIGRPVDLESQEPFQREEFVLRDSFQSLTGWTTGEAVDGGVVDGTMVVSPNGQDFIAADYGTGVYWHGPALKKSLSEPISDWRVEIYLRNFNHLYDSVGRVEVYLIDEAGVHIGKLAMTDSYAYQKKMRAEVRIGDQAGHYMIVTEGKRPGWWNGFQGILYLEKTGNRFFAYVSSIERGGHKRYREWWTGYDDLEGKYTGSNLAQVQVHLGVFGNYTPTDQALQQIVIRKYNNPEYYQIPYIAQVGDIVTFDHRGKGELLINGEPRMDIKDFGARYFKLKKGENLLTVYPSESFNVTCRYRERFL